MRGIESLLGTPLLARLATPPRKVVRRGGLVMYSRPQSEHGEAYRVLVANFDLANASSQSKVIMLTSAAAREGKTTATANLGIALARAGRRVAILDFDFHRPTLGGYFGLGKVSGLSDVLTGAAALSEATNRVPIRDSVNGTPSERPGDGELTVIPAGQAAARALDRVSTPLVGDLLEVAKHEFDVVLSGHSAADGGERGTRPRQGGRCGHHVGPRRPRSVRTASRPPAAPPALGPPGARLHRDGLRAPGRIRLRPTRVLQEGCSGQRPMERERQWTSR